MRLGRAAASFAIFVGYDPTSDWSATMNLHAPHFFVPPRPPVPKAELGWYETFKTLRTNGLQMWPQQAYEADVLVQTFLGRQRFLLNAPDAIHHVLVGHADNYTRTPPSIRILRPIAGEGLLLSEGEAWRHQRRTIAPALAPRVVPLLARHVATATSDLIARLAAAGSDEVDMLAAMQFLALEIAARSMFSLEMRQYGAALRAMIARFGDRLARPSFFDMMLPLAIPTLQDFGRRRFRKEWIALMDEIIESRLQAPASESARDLFDLLLAARDPETGAAFSRDQLRDQMATMIVAGHETTALTLFWALYLLASAPIEQERIAQEVQSLDLAPEGTAVALTKLIYTRAVVDETLRIYPPAFIIVRKAIAPDRIGDLSIPAGSMVSAAPWVLHHHLKLWKDPDAFNPSRFLGEQPKAPRFAYLPFGAGPRVCVGAQFALAEASLVLAALVQRFEIALADERPVLPFAIVTTQPDHPAPFRLRARR
jgi:cytochrome P450